MYIISYNTLFPFDVGFGGKRKAMQIFFLFSYPEHTKFVADTFFYQKISNFFSLLSTPRSIFMWCVSVDC